MPATTTSLVLLMLVGVLRPDCLARALPATAVGAAIERRVGLRGLIENTARDRLPAFAKVYASSIEIPLRFLPSFDLVEKRAPWDKSVGYTSLFALLDEARFPWYQCSWPNSTQLADPSDDGIVHQTLGALAQSQIHLDGKSHDPIGSCLIPHSP